MPQAFSDYQRRFTDRCSQTPVSNAILPFADVQRPHLGGWASTSEGASCKALLHYEVSLSIVTFSALAHDEVKESKEHGIWQAS